MLKLNASYSKKVPADGEYTSQSYHASIEVELPDEMLDYLPEQEKTQFQNKKYNQRNNNIEWQKTDNCIQKVIRNHIQFKFITQCNCEKTGN